MKRLLALALLVMPAGPAARADLLVGYDPTGPQVSGAPVAPSSAAAGVAAAASFAVFGGLALGAAGVRRWKAKRA